MAPAQDRLVTHSRTQHVAVLIACLNEEKTIAKVVADFKSALPACRVYVFDNASTDRSAELAVAAGAEVIRSPERGKGRVVQHMFRAVSADIYVLVDGDDTYSAASLPQLIDALESTAADMVVASRLEQHSPHAFRSMHKLGNRMISGLIGRLFNARLTDVLSGYRAVRRGLARSLHLQSATFEIETEMTLQALVRRRKIVEIPVPYGERPAGSESKLDSFSDGLRILKLIVLIFKDYKPLVFFLFASAVSFALGVVAGWPPVLDYIHTRFVSHVPMALLAAALEILAVLFAGIGLVLNAIRNFHFEVLEGLERVQRPIDDAES
jgi:glycosyltransferase involved in cell wall biosynthesis